jgi:hypothetical protein
MTVALVDDQLLSQILRGKAPRRLASSEIYTTGYWYVRLCQAVLGSNDRLGKFSRPFAELPPNLEADALRALLALPSEIGMLCLRDLGPTIALLRREYDLNILSIEALAAATLLDAHVHLSAPSPLLEAALTHHKLKVTVTRRR